jgi:hypothetical protein
MTVLEAAKPLSPPAHRCLTDEQPAPPCEKDLVNAEGKVLRKAGDPFDAHHVIENIYGEPHKWWNRPPGRFPDQHQGGLHLDAIMDTQFP